jgi:hypothetical protein
VPWVDCIVEVFSGDGRMLFALACTVPTRWCWKTSLFQLKTSLAPLFGLFSVLSSDKSTSGDLLDVKLK